MLAKLYVLAIFAAFCAASFMPWLHRLARTHGIVDRPGGRRTHTQPTPRLGGVAIFLSMLLCLCAVWVLNRHVAEISAGAARKGVGFFIGASLMFALGLADDLRSRSPYLKFLVQILAACLVVGSGVRLERLSLGSWETDLPWLWGAPLTVLWIVTVTNAINLVDGLDGLAGGVVITTLGCILVLAGLEHTTVAVVATILIGATLGFLLFNYQPASIFLGDSGSLFLGFSVGTLSAMLLVGQRLQGLDFVPLLIVALPLADTFWAAARRTVKGHLPKGGRQVLARFTRVFVPDRKHLHHKLLERGLSSRQVVYVLLGGHALCCMIALCLALGQLETPPVGPPADAAVPSDTLPVSPGTP